MEFTLEPKTNRKTRLKSGIFAVLLLCLGCAPTTSIVAQIPWANGARIAIITDTDKLLGVCKECYKSGSPRVDEFVVANIGVIRRGGQVLQASGGGIPINRLRLYTVEHQDGKFRLKSHTGAYLTVSNSLAGSSMRVLIAEHRLVNGKIRGEGLFEAVKLGSDRYAIKSTFNGKFLRRYHGDKTTALKSGLGDVIAADRKSSDEGFSRFTIIQTSGVSWPPKDERHPNLLDVVDTFYDKFTVKNDPFNSKLKNNGAKTHLTTIKDYTKVGLYDDGTLLKKNPLGPGDHPNSMTMTRSGRIVFDMSRVKGDLKATGGGCIIISEPGSLTDLSRKNWTVDCNFGIYNDYMQAVGEILMITSADGEYTEGVTRFFRIDSKGKLQELKHLRQYNPDRYFQGITFSEKDKRYYAYEASGASKEYYTKPKTQFTLYQTRTGMRLSDVRNAFTKVDTVQNIPLGQQAGNLICQSDGTLFVVSAYARNPEHIEGALSAVGLLRPYVEALSLVKIGIPTVGKVTREEVWHKETGMVYGKLGGTETDWIDLRPSWRFAGAFVPTSSTSGVALWTGNWKSLIPTNPFTGGHRYASRTLGTLD